MSFLWVFYFRVLIDLLDFLFHILLDIARRLPKLANALSKTLGKIRYLLRTEEYKDKKEDEKDFSATEVSEHSYLLSIDMGSVVGSIPVKL